MTWWRQRRGLYAILDPDYTNNRDPLVITDQLLAAPCAILQLRCKSKSDRDFLALARALREKTRAAKIPFVINDRADIAKLVDADGLHLGQDDLPIAEARKFFPDRAISISTHNLEQAQRAQQSGADLIAVGPIFETTTKKNPDPVVGLEQLQIICRSVSAPVIAIGGINLDNLARIVDAGARFAVAISAVTTSDSPSETAHAFASTFAKTRRLVAGVDSDDRDSLYDLMDGRS